MSRIGWVALAFAAIGFAVLAGFGSVAVAAETFVVDTVSEDEALSACANAPADCSFEGAVAAANATAGADVIEFDIPADSCPDGVCRIEIDETFVNITEAVTIDGTTQPQHDGPQANVCATETAPSHMRIELVATDPTGYSGLYLNHATGSSTIKGLALGVDGYDFATLILVQQGSGHHISCNHLGLDADGSAELGIENAIEAVLINLDASDVTIGTDGDGSDDLAERNIIGHANAAAEILGDGVVFAGNWVGIGTDEADFRSGLGVEIQQFASDVVVGTNEDGISDELERNYFGYSGNWGVWAKPAGAATATDWRIIGNTFGLTPSGVTPSGLSAGVTEAIDIDPLATVNTGFEIRKNIFYAGTTPVYVNGSEAGASMVITDNWFGTMGETIGGNGTDFGVVAEGSGSFHIADNWFHSVPDGVVLNGSTTLTAGSEGNCMSGNNGGFTNNTGAVVTFENNWWNDATGPSGAGSGSGFTVSSNVDFDPWLSAKPSLCNNAPVTEDKALEVGEFEAPPNEMGVVAGSDVDGDPLTYSILSGNADGVFEIDASSGLLTQVLFLDYETTPRYVLEIEVTDGTDPVISTWTIDVVDGFETPTTSTFSDIPTDHQFFREIEYMVWAEITLGCDTDGTLYCPTESVTRAQMGSFLARALELAPIPGDRFDDVSGVHEANINAIAEAGITLGCDTDGVLYCPDDPITRAQMGSFLARAFGHDPVPGNRFDDVSGTHTQNINAIAEAGITLGCNPEGTLYCPDEQVTRAQMAAFIFRGIVS